MNDEAPGSESGAELELRILQAAVADNDDGSYELRLLTTRGELGGLLHPCEGGTAAVVFLGGAGGAGRGLGGPGSVYARLAESLTAARITSLRLQMRRPDPDPASFQECVLDALAGVSFLRGIGAERIVLVGVSYGGGVVIRAGTLSEHVRAVAAISTQTFGSEAAPQLAPRPLLLVHGLDDDQFSPAVAQQIYDRAGEPKRLVLLGGVDHFWREGRDELFDLLRGWIERQAVAGG
ncbi:MAG TPA: alpha/beta hydrolase [Dehalococcoidia bacterium]